MAFEVTCGECNGQLLIETAGVIVECPLCGAHLSIPESAAEPVPEESHSPVIAEPTTPETPTSATAVLAAPESVPSETSPPVDSMEHANGNGQVVTTENVAEAWVSHSQPNLAEFLTAAPSSSPLTDELPVNPEEQRLAEEPTQVLSKQAAVELQAAVEPAPTAASPESAPVPPAQPELSASAPTPPGSAVDSAPSAPEPHVMPAPADMVPRHYFILVAGYASAVTLALLYLLFNSRTHALESLPDLVPQIRKDGAVGMPRVLPKMNVAEGHELHLGQSERYGNVRVTPVKVTRGPVKFVHGYGNARATKEPSAPVLKLWLKFENVSRSQEFPPLDRTLVFRRIFDKKLKSEFALSFVCREDQRTRDKGERYFAFDMPEFSEFHLADQNLNRWLQPGESWETYIPSVEDLVEVDGVWVWRVLFRKGLNASSGRGVTTLIDVKFTGDDVIVEG